MKKNIAFLLLMILPVSMVSAFPLYPPRIHIQGDLADQAGEPITSPQEIEFSVWQGGKKTELDSGRLIYQEQMEVQPGPDGHFDYWLGKGTVLSGNFEGEDYALNHKLYLQTRITGKAGTIHKRRVIHAIDGAYTAYGGALYGAVKARHARRDYTPDFNEASPALLRQPVARLYPDGKIQRENGALIETTGSTTSGVQELFDYCAEHNVNGYIVGGTEPRAQQVVYMCHTPVRIHPAQGFYLDTGSITLSFPGSIGSENGLTIDSCMMVDIRIRGLVLYRGTGYAVAVKPENLLPLDTFVGATIVDTTVYITSIANSGSAFLFDGSINYSRFIVNEINGGDYGVHVTADSGFSNNKFTCKHIHGQDKIGLNIEAGLYNLWEINYNCDAKDPYGIVTAGRDDIWFAAVQTNKAGLILQEQAQGNQFHLMNLSGGLINKAKNPTNRIYASPSIASKGLSPGYGVETPGVGPSQSPVMNRHPFPVVIMIKKAGQVTGWSLTDTQGISEHIEAPLVAGASIMLMPGESIAFDYETDPPEWKWRVIQ